MMYFPPSGCDSSYQSTPISALGDSDNSCSRGHGYLLRAIRAAIVRNMNLPGNSHVMNASYCLFNARSNRIGFIKARHQHREFDLGLHVLFNIRIGNP